MKASGRLPGVLYRSGGALTGLVTSTHPVLAKQPACRLRLSADQSIGNNAFTAASFGVEDYDTDTMHDNAVNPTRLTIKTAGVYSFAAYAFFASNATGLRAAGYRLNGAGAIHGQQVVSAANDAIGRVSTVWEHKLAVNDFIEFMVFQASGGALNLDATDAAQGDTYVAAHWLGLGV